MMRGLVSFAAVVLCSAVMLTAAAQPAQTPAAPAQAAPDGLPPDWLPPAPKNLKILPKEITPAELLTVMRGFTQAMGVRCAYCHVAGSDPTDMSAYNFASDRKEHKETTRAMLKYTDAVNEIFPKEVGDQPVAGEQRVTCYTCHQGKREPPTRLTTARPGAPATPGAQPPAAAQPPQGQPPRPPL